MTVSYDPTRLHHLFRFQNWLDERIGSPRRRRSALDEQALLATARRRANCDDFGSDEFLEPLRVLLAAAQEPGALTCTGRSLLRAIIVKMLRVRLLAEQAVRLHPEILDQPVKRPLVVVGLPRTGTTLLSHLLAQDPVSRPVLGWEALNPAPVHPDQARGAVPRRFMVVGAIGEWASDIFLPGLREVHSFAYNQPDECHWLYFPSFISPPAMVFSPVRAWMKQQPEATYDIAYRHYRRALQMLEWQRPARGHWVLKSPLHLWALESYLKAMPEASLIQTHRRLDEVLPSFCSLAAMLMNLFSNRVEAPTMGETVLEFAQDMIDRFTSARARAGSAPILDLRYPDLVADPVGSVRRIYDRFDYAFTPEVEGRLRSYGSDQKQTHSARHRYTLEQFGLCRDQVLERFADYHRQFGLV